MKLEKSDILDLYKLTASEIEHISVRMNGRLVWFTSLISALLAGTIAGVFKASVWHHYAILCLSPIMICALSYLATHSLGHLYRQFLERVSIRSKYENILGLHSPFENEKDDNNFLWNNEPVIPSRFRLSHKKFSTSEDWINFNHSQGFRYWTVLFFQGVIIVSMILFISLLSFAIWHFNS